METNASFEPNRLETRARRVVAELQTLLESDREHSFVVERAVERFAEFSDGDELPSSEDYSRWLTPLGESLRSSICRQLEVDGYFNRQSWYRSIQGVADWPEQGDRIGAFHLLEQVGKGAQSRVFLCRQAGVGDRQVIVKFTRSSLLEADVLGRLRHPNIVPIHSAAADDQTGISHLCMPFLGRSTLGDFIDAEAESGDFAAGDLLSRVANQTRRPSDAVGDGVVASARPTFYDKYDCIAWIGWRLATALAHAHEHGIVHGDVKPSNVLLAWDGTPLLMDFNLSGSLTHAVEAKGGTLPYMPPEQLQAVGLERGDAVYDQRSDLFSLGVLLYEALSGRLPFPLDATSGDRRALATELLRQQREGFTPLLQLDRNVPAGLATIVERCLYFDPVRRFQSADALAELLGRSFTGRGRVIRAARRYRWPLLASSIVTGAIALGAGVAIASRPPEHMRLYNAGVELLREGRDDEARIALDRSVTLQAKNNDARFALGLALLHSGEHDRAKNCFSDLHKRERTPRAAAYVGYADSKRGDVSSILAHDKLVDGDGDCPEVRNNLAVAYELGRTRLSAKQQYLAAKQHLTHARTAWPDSPTVRYNWLRLQLVLADHGLTPINYEDAVIATELAAEFPGDQYVQKFAAEILSLRTAMDASQQDAALDCLERAVDAGYRVVEANRVWRPLRSSPRFATIRQKSQAAAPRKNTPPMVSRFIEPKSLNSLIADSE